MKRLFILLFSFSLVIALVACGSAPEVAEKSPQLEKAAEPKAPPVDKQAEFFKGKTIDFIVTYSPGGGYDTVARELAPYIKKYSGATVLVKNISGGGGNVGTNTLYKAKADGLTIGMVNGGGMLVGQLLNSKDILKLEGIEFDMSKFSYLGRVNYEPKVTYTGGDNKEINSIEDVIKSQDTLTFGGVGPQDDTILMQMGLKAALNLPIRFVFGYEGMSNVELAVMSGELDLSAGSAPSRMPKIKAESLKPLVLVGGAFEELPDVHRAVDYAQGEESRKLLQSLDVVSVAGRVIAAPPGVPEERRLFLEEIVKKSLNDPELQEQFIKEARPVQWLSGNDYQKEIVDKVFTETPQLLFDVWKEEISKINN